MVSGAARCFAAHFLWLQLQRMSKREAQQIAGEVPYIAGMLQSDEWLAIYTAMPPELVASAQFGLASLKVHDLGGETNNQYPDPL